MRQALTTAARAAIAACDGGALVMGALAGAAAPEYARVWAVGKAAAAMARGFPDAFVVDKRMAGHPWPDAGSVAAAARIAAEASALAPDERALLLLSGGASALMGAPVAGLGLDDFRAATRALVEGGAAIHEINRVRRHLTRLGGGRLAALCPAALEVLALSDVAGDDPATIGSGPASPDPSTRAEALALARRYRLPAAALAAIAGGDETPKPGDPVFARVRYRVLASPATLAAAATAAVANAGWAARARPGLVAGDVADFAVELAAVAPTLEPGEVYVAVGEPTVRVAPPAGVAAGRGGRAQQLALTLAVALAGSGLAFVAIGSDGSDGPTSAAGAAVDGDTAAALAAAGVDAGAALARFDAHTALGAVAALVVTGDTGTNLTDLYLLGRAGAGA